MSVRFSVANNLKNSKRQENKGREKYFESIYKRKYIGCVGVKPLQLCSNLCDRMDCGPPDSSVHGILQERILELPCPPAGDLPNSWIESRSPALQADSLASEPPGKPNSYLSAIKCSNVLPLYSTEAFKERRAQVNIYLQNTWLEHHLSLGLILYLINVCFPTRL